MNKVLITTIIWGILTCSSVLPAQTKSHLGQEVPQSTVTGLPVLSLKQFKKLRAQGDVVVLDTRSADEFLKGFIPGAINIGFKGPFDTFLAEVIPNRNQKLLLVIEQEDHTAVGERLVQLGYTAAIGVLDGGMERWKERETVDSVVNLTAQKFGERSDPGHIVDVRTEKEFDKGHIDNAMNIPLSDFANFGNTLKKDGTQLYVHCQSGYRSAVAVSILRAKGFKNVCNIQGGYKALKDEIKEN